jgi:SH3-like domain-containing protein
MPYDAIVISAHRTQYPNPIRFKAGDRVTVVKRDDEYPGWIWTTVVSGHSAWAPEELLSVSGADAVALADYESTELNTEPDECVRVMFELLEWAWVENAAGREGWVPIKTLQPTRQRLP